MQYFTSAQARQFAAEWLPAWTGNDPERLAAFYSEDTFYSDPVVPLGVRGRPALLEYLRKLLRYNPSWTWTQVEAIPLEGGFLNKCQASIPVGSGLIQVISVCLVQLDARRRIRRNEVYFDRSAFLHEVERQRAR